MSAAGPPPGMVPMWGLAMGGDGPARLADLSSVALDLGFAAEAFHRVAEMDEEADSLARRALWDAGVIAYRRGFNTGRSLLAKAPREHLPQAVVDALDPALRQAHDEVLEEANQHVAHRVAEHEQARVILLLSNPKVGRWVDGLTMFHMRYIGADEERARAAALVASALQEAAAAEVEAFQQGLIEAAKGQDLDALYRAAHPLGAEPEDGAGSAGRVV